MKKKIIVIIVCFITNVFSQGSYYYEDRQSYNGYIDISEGRQVFLLNDNWQYLEKDCDFQELGRESEWHIVKLPHTWNSLDATDNEPGYRRSGSWYRKEIKIPPDIKDSVWRLYFEGVNISCDVYVNGKKAGAHIGGYVGFTIDITSFLKPGRSNELLVKADNSVNRNIIPSQKSDFFIFGGITRDVWLQVLPASFINHIQIQTPEVNKNTAVTRITADIINSQKKNQKRTVSFELFDPSGKHISNKVLEKEFVPGKNSVFIELPVVENPQLWSPGKPDLYTTRVTLDGSIKDELSEKFGYRWFNFEDHGPFYLNDERLLLRGTHRHEEYAGYGNAMPDSLHRKDIAQIKEMGANFVRLAHYPQDPEIYRACDELGLLIWDELPWCRGGMGGAEWKTNTLRLFEEQINQNYNHPSIIFWSVGNELYWEPDFPGGDNPDSLKVMVSRLNDLAHQLDPYRLTTMRKYYDGAEITDVFSPSIWAGWYSGVYKTYQKALEQARPEYKRFVHTEYGGSSHIGKHTENPISGEGIVKENEWDEKPNMINIKRISSEGDWSENYIVDLFDWHLQVSERLDWFAGNAQWAFKDFGTPLRPENPIPFINQKGLVDREGKPKDAYYVFKSYWTKDPKFCYIESKTWTDRYGKKNQERQVCVYSNCDEVRLLVNGKDSGNKVRDISQFPACGLNWNVRFAEGENQIIALGYNKDEVSSTDTLNIRYHTQMPDKAERIALSSRDLSNGHLLIVAQVVDNKGERVPDYNKRAYFDLNGAGRLLKHRGTPTGSNVIEFANGKAAIEYIPDNNKRAIIEVRSQDFKGDYIVIN